MLTTNRGKPYRIAIYNNNRNEIYALNKIIMNMLENNVDGNKSFQGYSHSLLSSVLQNINL